MVIMVCFYRTSQKDCEAMINFCASEEGRALVVNRFIDEHNHEVSKVHCLHENTNMVSIILVGVFVHVGEEIIPPIATTEKAYH